MEKDYAAGWMAAAQEAGDLAMSIENEDARRVAMALYHRLVAKGLELKALPPIAASRFLGIETDDGTLVLGDPPAIES